MSVSCTTMLFIICWQFAQFTLFTQTCAIFAVYLLGVLPPDTMHSILVAQVILRKTKLIHKKSYFGKLFYKLQNLMSS